MLFKSFAVALILSGRSLIVLTTLIFRIFLQAYQQKCGLEYFFVDQNVPWIFVFHSGPVWQFQSCKTFACSKNPRIYILAFSHIK